MMYSCWHSGLTAKQAADLAKCAEAAQLAINADNVRRAQEKAKDDERNRKMMSVYLNHLKRLPDATQPPSTSFFSQ